MSARRFAERPRGDGDSPLDVIVDPRFVDPEDRLHLQDLVRLVYQSLNEQERFIVYFYFYREMTMKEIGVVLSLSESRVCQILSKLVHRVKRKLSRIERELTA
jgi:RNA polymerase sigma factor for flagellar operon FliA